MCILKNLNWYTALILFDAYYSHESSHIIVYLVLTVTQYYFECCYYTLLLCSFSNEYNEGFFAAGNLNSSEHSHPSPFVTHV